MEYIISIIIPTFSSLMVIAVVYLIREHRLKIQNQKILIVYLNAVVLESVVAIKKELKNVNQVVDELFTNEEVAEFVFGMYPTLNSKIFDELHLKDAQKILDIDIILLMNVIGMVENIRERLPLKIVTTFSQKVEAHFVEVENLDSKHPKYFEETIFKSELQHYNECPTILSYKREAKSEIKLVGQTLDELMDMIEGLNVKMTGEKYFVNHS